MDEQWRLEKQPAFYADLIWRDEPDGHQVLIAEVHWPDAAEHIVALNNAARATDRAELEALRAALSRARLWLEGAAETFAGQMDCGEEDDLDPSDCDRHDSYCERFRDMNRGIAEIDAALAAQDRPGGSDGG